MKALVSAPPTSAVFRALLLGSFVLERDGVPVDTSKWRRRVSSLFKLLIITPERRRHRDEVIDILWPDAGTDAGVGNLRITAHRLRLALAGQEPSVASPSPVLSEHGWIALSPSYTWDVDIVKFERMARTAGSDVAALEEALTLFRGEPLVEERYEDWAMPIRESLQQTWRSAALRLSDGYQSSARHNEAVELLERLLRDDSLDEESLRRLLEVLYSAGRRIEALRRYQQFEQQLAEELGAPPSPETMALVQRLSAQFPEPSPPQIGDMSDRPLPIGRFLGALPDAPLVGRDEELERILFVADLAEGAAGRLVLVGGERGAGKTRLAQEVALRLRDRGFFVVTGRCHERQQHMPLHPFVEIMEALLPAVPPAFRRELALHWPLDGALLPERASDQSAPLRGASHGGTEPAGEAEQESLLVLIGSIVAALAEKKPIAVLLDDLHWSDERSLDLLGHLARQMAGHRIFLLATYRDDVVERGHPLDRLTTELVREGLVARVAARRLSLEGTAALVEATVGAMDASAEFADFVYRKTRGNPFFIDQMLQTLGGRYALIRQVAAGSMGRIFEAVDTTSGDVVAAKVMFSRTEADPQALRRFEQEGAVLTRLQHPNIVAIHGTYLQEFTNCIVMEMLEGVTLGRLLHSEHVDLDRLKHIALQVTAALACAHEQGIVHRDIKPDNIIVLPGDRVKVTDFGIARLVRPKPSLTTQPSTGMTMGTPLYMAPEQVEGRRIDGRADLYSLGGVLYEAVTGQAPFSSDDPLTVALKHVHEPPVPPRSIDSTIPPDWEELILKALAKEPAARFPSAAAMGQAIAELGSRRDTAIGDHAPALAGEIVAVLPARPAPTAPLTTAAGKLQPMQMPAHLPATPAAVLVPPSGRGRRRAIWGAGLAASVLAVGAATFFAGRVLPGAHPTAARTPTTRSAGPPAVNAHGVGPGQFLGPTGLTLDALGSIYAIDSSNNRVQEFSPRGDFLARFPRPGDSTYTLNHPTDLAIAPNGNLYIADFGNDRIVEIGPDGTYLPPIQLFKKHEPRAFNSVTIDLHGNLYATDLNNAQILKLSAAGKQLGQWGRPGAQSGHFSHPEGIAFGPHGVYVVDNLNNRVQELVFSSVPPFRRVIHILGGRQGTGPNELHGPQAVAVDHWGNVYIADTGNNRVQEFSSSGRYVRTFAGVSAPSGVAVDPQGNVYVSDYINDRIDKFSPTARLIWYTNGRHPIRLRR